MYEGYSGEATVTINDKNITIIEKLDEFAENIFTKISLAHYNNLNGLLPSALNRLQLTIFPGIIHYPWILLLIKMYSLQAEVVFSFSSYYAASIIATSISVSKKIFEIDLYFPG